MKVPIYDFPNHTKNDTFLARQITFNFDITGASILMQFKANQIGQINGDVFYEWKTDDNSFDIIDPILGIIVMKEKIISAPIGTYCYDLQITYQTGQVITYFKGKQNIIQDISTP